MKSLQRKPKFNGMIIVVLLALSVLALNLWSLMNTSTTTMSYSRVLSYFQSQQVVGFEMDLNTGDIKLALVEGDVELPSNAVDTGKQPATRGQLTQGGMFDLIRSQSQSATGAKETVDRLPSGEGIWQVEYRVPYFSIFYEEVQPYVQAYNEAHPDAPMYQDYTPVKSSVPIWDIMMMVVMVGSMIFIFYVMFKGNQGGNIMNVGRAKVKDQNDDKRKTTFADVAGADEEKAELEEIVQFLKNPGQFNSLGARIPHGVLLVGPPGTGKTLLARACAGEAGVPFYSISGSDFVEMYVGVGASRVRDLFDKAKKTAPSIIFIDEIDAVGRQRGTGLGGGHDEREQTLNQMLVEMDGFGANEGVIVIAATNRADILDHALLRPGRFDRQVYVGLPDVKGREEILKVHTRKKPLAPDVNLKTIAQSTAGFAGADLENLVNEAALLAARRGKKAITEKEIEEASIKVVAGPEKKSRVVTEKEKKLTAYHEAGHAITSWFCPTNDPVHQISIIPRGQAGGYTMYLPDKDASYVTKTAMQERIVSLLGGRVAESLVLDDISTGASNDLERATDTARTMVTRYGFSERLGPVVYGSDPEETFLGRDFSQGKGYSDSIAAEIDSEIRDIVDEAYERARRILSDNMDKLHVVAAELIKREKLSGEEFKTLMEGGTLPETEQPAPAAAPAEPVQPAEPAQAAEPAEPAQPAETAETAEPLPEQPDQGEKPEGSL